ncbi:MAG: hypothetical protein ACYTFQ_12300 [Planctomycetota bacterium]
MSWRIKCMRGLEKRRGPGCQCCGYEPDPKNRNGVACLMTEKQRYMFLAVDHVHNNGSSDRKTLGLRGEKFFKSVIDRDYPGTIQLLCHSCNQAKRLNKGVCPHEEES